MTNQDYSYLNENRRSDGKFGSGPANESDLTSLAGEGDQEVMAVRRELASAHTPDDLSDETVQYMLDHHPDGSTNHARWDQDAELDADDFDDFEQRAAIALDAYVQMDAWAGESSPHTKTALSDWDSEHGDATLSVPGRRVAEVGINPTDIADGDSVGQARLNAARAFLDTAHSLKVESAARTAAARDRKVAQQSDAAYRLAGGAKAGDAHGAVRAWAIEAAYPGLDEEQTYDTEIAVRDGNDDGQLAIDLDNARIASQDFEERVGTIEADQRRAHAVQKMLEFSDRTPINAGMQMAFPNLDGHTRARLGGRLIGMQRDYAHISVDDWPEHSAKMDKVIHTMIEHQRRAEA